MARNLDNMAHRPKSVEEIVKAAQDFDHKSDCPLRIALRTAQNISKQAANCERDGNIQDAYFFLYRHAEFCMSKVATHPERKQPEFKQQMARVTKEVKADLLRLEELKPEIKRGYERYQESMRRIEMNRNQEREQNEASGNSSSRVHPGWDQSQILIAGENSDLALKLAHREQRRRNVAQTGQHGGVDDLSRSIAALGKQLDGHGPETNPKAARHLEYSYPEVPAHAQSRSSMDTGYGARPIPKSVLSSGLPPALPSKSGSLGLAPPVPLKAQSPSAAVPAIPSKEDLISSNYTFKPLAFSEAGAPLRPVFLPTELRTQFLALAQSNTTRNLETCGILCGTLISGALFISHLVIPDQESTSDTCDTTEEGDNALFDYVDGEQLMVCGWIHTHPSQTCFLSSRDLHTSVGYQVMLPESIAIVCSPKHQPDHGIFRLTDPPGKQAILGCTRTGLFHPHEQTNLYTDASRPGHVNELKGLQFQTVDLRKKKG